MRVLPWKYYRQTKFHGINKSGLFDGYNFIIRPRVLNHLPLGKMAEQLGAEVEVSQRKPQDDELAITYDGSGNSVCYKDVYKSIYNGKLTKALK